MEPLVDVDAVRLRASQYWMEDGLVELMFGLTVVSASGVPLAVRALSEGPFQEFMSAFGTQALSVVSIYLATWGLKKLKERITFPRCGYVAFPQPTKKRRAMMVVFMLLTLVAMMLATLLLADYEAWVSRMFMPAVTVTFVVCFLVGGLQYKQPTMIWEAFLTALFAVILGLFTNLGGGQGFEVLTVMIGTSMAIIGALRLRSFLKANPRPQETEA